jgi:serine/threonine protein kinase
MMRDLIGQHLGNYRLVRLLGRGGFAEVYLGQHVQIDTQQAAIKVLYLTGVDPHKFRQEAQTITSLKHPNIIRLFDFSDQQMPYLVMDYAPNGSLGTRHAAGEKVPLVTVVRYVTQIANALQYAHGMHIIHRDIKPDNVLLGSHSELLLSDFGIAVLSKTGRATVNAPGGMAGTPYYMAPEMFRGKPDKASDQYALAVMVYQWLSGTLPFSEGDFIQLGYQHAHESVPPLCERAPLVSGEAEAVVMKALAKDLHQRFATVQAFATALEQASQSGKNQPPALPKPVTPLNQLEERQLAISPLEATPSNQLLPPTIPATPLKLSPQPITEISSHTPASHIPRGTLLSTYCGHSHVSAVAWSLDGKCIASASSDKTVQVWDAVDGGNVFTYKGHSNIVSAVAWSPDGKLIASGSFVWNSAGVGCGLHLSLASPKPAPPAPNWSKSG